MRIEYPNVSTLADQMFDNCNDRAFTQIVRAFLESKTEDANPPPRQCEHIPEAASEVLVIRRQNRLKQRQLQIESGGAKREGAQVFGQARPAKCEAGP